jgi:protocatechuate 3,4-dioxygenase beta subunit
MAFFELAVDLERRRLIQLALGSAALVACGGQTSEPATPSPAPTTTTTTTATTTPTTTPPVDAGSDAIPDTTYPTPTCMETETNIEGPYYRAAAPFRADLRTGVTTGVLLILRGRVFGVGCTKPLTDAIVDVWQADGDGHYDNDGTLTVPPSDYRLRGRVKVDAAGNYEVSTVIPGHYLNGSQYRPAHIHVKVSAAGHRLLTTQLYFEGDPYNGIDPFIKKPLIMKIESLPSGEKLAKYDFVLATT